MVLVNILVLADIRWLLNLALAIVLVGLLVFIFFEFVEMFIKLVDELPVIEVGHFRDSENLYKSINYIKSDGLDVE